MASAERPQKGMKFVDIFIEKANEGFELQRGEKPWQYRKRIQQQQINKGSNYPPFNIQPGKDVRERLYGEDGKGMTPEQRAMRARWVRDQRLAENEPVVVPHPRNIFRRIYGIPMAAIYKLQYQLRNKIIFWQPPVALPPRDRRRMLPWALIIYGGMLAVYYNLKYKSRKWENKDGVNVVFAKEPMLYGPIKLEKELHYDNGFSERKAALDMKTSFNSERRTFEEARY